VPPKYFNIPTERYERVVAGGGGGGGGGCGGGGGGGFRYGIFRRIKMLMRDRDTGDACIKYIYLYFLIVLKDYDRGIL